MVNGEIICRLACKEIHIGGHRSRKLVREAHNFLNSCICFLYVWDNFSFMGVMGSTTRSCLGSWWRLRLEEFCCWLENVKQKVVEAFTVILAVFELLYLISLHAGILGGEYGPSYTNNNNTNATATVPAAAVSEKHLHGTAAAAAVWSSSSHRASQLQINPWCASSSSSSSSFQFQYCQQIQLLLSATTVAFNQIPLETDQETGIFWHPLEKVEVVPPSTTSSDHQHKRNTCRWWWWLLLMGLGEWNSQCTFMQKRTSLISVERRGELTLFLCKGNCTLVNLSGKVVV